MIIHIINLIKNTLNIYNYLLLVSYIFFCFYILKNKKELKDNNKLIIEIKKMCNFACMLFLYFLIKYWVIQSNLIVLFPLGIVYLLTELIIQKTIKGDDLNMSVINVTLSDIRENYPYSFNLILSVLTSVAIIGLFDFLFLDKKIYG